MTRLRVLLAGVWHESHSFASEETRLAHFEQHARLSGIDVLEHFRGTQTEIGGALSVLEKGAPGRSVTKTANGAALEVVGGAYAGALPSGPVAPDTWKEIKEEILASIDASTPDAVFLSLHGAMVVPGEPDPEGELLRRVRSRLGDRVPIAVTLDCHANLGPDLVEAADIVVAYDTYPHVDFAERGAEAASLLVRILDGESFSRGLVQVPIAPPLLAQETARSPMRELLRAAHELEARPGWETVSWMAGFPYSDVARMGMSAAIVASRAPSEIADALLGLARDAWEARTHFAASTVPVDEAVQRAARAGEGPVILVDVSDNVGGGTPGDGTAILAGLIRHRLRGSVVTIKDPEAVEAAEAAGVGGEFSLDVGGKTDRFHGDPVRLRGTVAWVGDGRFTVTGIWMRGTQLDPGRSARVTSEEGVDVIVTERKTPPFDGGLLYRAGVEPERCRVIVAKSAIAWKGAFGAFAKDAVYVDTPGICTQRVERLPYRNRRRPLLPFEPETTFDATRVYAWPARRRG